MKLQWLTLLPLTLATQIPFSSDQILSPDISSFIQNLLEEWNSAGGIAVSVVQLDNTSWISETKGFGYANERGELVDGDSQFCVASNSKVVSQVYSKKLFNEKASFSQFSLLDYWYTTNH